jgi:hypothetical protein
MGILKNIWNTIFGKSKKQEQFGRGGSIEEPKMEVVYKKCKDKTEAVSTYAENELVEPNPQVCNEVQERISSIDSQIKFEVSEPKPKKQKIKKVVGQKTLSEIKDYLLTYGSIDVLTCEQKFKVKSLHNFIWHLRKQGLKIKTDKVGLHNELGQKVEVTNYRLIVKK